jgi:hypothetical protein
MKKINKLSLLTFLLLSSSALYSKGTVAGTNIVTKAKISYNIGKVKVLDENLSSQSLTVYPLSNLNVSNNSTTTKVLSETVAFIPFEIINQGNTKDSFKLSLSNISEESNSSIDNFNAEFKYLSVRYLNDQNKTFIPVDMSQVINLNMDETLLVRAFHQVPKELDEGSISNIQLSVMSELETKLLTNVEAKGIYVVKEIVEDALNIEKSAVENNETSEITFSINIMVNRDVSKLIINDEIEVGMEYKIDSLTLNGKEHTLVDNKINIALGDVKAGEQYTISYTATTL